MPLCGGSVLLCCVFTVVKLLLTQLLLTWTSMYIQRVRVKGKGAMELHPTVRKLFTDIGGNVGIVFATMVMLSVVKVAVSALN